MTIIRQSTYQHTTYVSSFGKENQEPPMRNRRLADHRSGIVKEYVVLPRFLPSPHYSRPNLFAVDKKMVLGASVCVDKPLFRLHYGNEHYPQQSRLKPRQILLQAFSRVRPQHSGDHNDEGMVCIGFKHGAVETSSTQVQFIADSDQLIPH